MSVQATVTRSYKGPGATSTTTQTEAVTGDTSIGGSYALPVAANQQIHLAFTRANLQCLQLYSDAAVTIYTNDVSGGTPQDTIALVAGQNKLWTLATDLLADCPFSGNVTTIYITNASGGTANVVINAVANQGP